MESKIKMKPVLTAAGHVMHAQLAVTIYKIKMRQVLIAADHVLYAKPAVTESETKMRQVWIAEEQPVMHAVGICQHIISYSS